MQKIDLPFNVKWPVLACGADMKGAFALAKGSIATVVDGFGDLSNPDNLASYEKALGKAVKRSRATPKIVACDLHPGYFSTNFAETYSLSAKRYTLLRVQHHEAHIASAMANNAIKGDVIGVAFDGTGYGSDGNIWGGEFFLGNLAGFRRMAHLDYIPMPGGDATVREPWRMAASYLYRVYGGRFLKRDIDFVKGIDARQWAVLKAMIDKKINSPLTSSAGRLFDAVGSIVLLKKYADSEAQLPIELEKMAIKSCDEAYGFEIKSRAAIQVIDVSKMLKTIVEDLSNGVSRPIISTRFHNTIANLITKTVLNLRKKFLVKKVVLSGGVFQNRYLTGKTVSALQKSGMAVYTNSKVETSDAGIPVGQVAIADARLVCA